MKKLALAALLAAFALPALAQSNDPFGQQMQMNYSATHRIVRQDFNIRDNDDNGGLVFWLHREHRAVALKLFLDYEIMDYFKVTVIPAHGVFTLDTGARWPAAGTCTSNDQRITCELTAGPGALFIDMDSSGHGTIFRTAGHSVEAAGREGKITPVKKTKIRK